MITFSEYFENRLTYHSNIDSLSGIKTSDMTTRDPDLRNSAKLELINFFRNHDNVIKFMTNPEVRKVLIPLIEKEPSLRQVIDELSAGKYGYFTSLTTRHSSDNF